ncbi:hypothetical protein G9A89_007260 [Geosiphon pyriformis]|nr:hypothetical protein G9A89_007260 [Geosiphon pyriformis]
MEKIQPDEITTKSLDEASNLSQLEEVNDEAKSLQKEKKIGPCRTARLFIGVAIVSLGTLTWRGVKWLVKHEIHEEQDICDYPPEFRQGCLDSINPFKHTSTFSISKFTFEPLSHVPFQTQTTEETEMNMVSN